MNGYSQVRRGSVQFLPIQIHSIHYDAEGVCPVQPLGYRDAWERLWTFEDMQNVTADMEFEAAMTGAYQRQWTESAAGTVQQISVVVSEGKLQMLMDIDDVSSIIFTIPLLFAELELASDKVDGCAVLILKDPLSGKSLSTMLNLQSSDAKDTWLLRVGGQALDLVQKKSQLSEALAMLGDAGAIRPDLGEQYSVSTETIPSKDCMLRAYKKTTDRKKSKHALDFLRKPSTDETCVASYAARVVDKSSTQQNDSRREVSMLVAAQSHPNITRFYGLFDHMSRFVVVTEHPDGGTLTDVLGGNAFPEDKTRVIMQGLVSGLNHIHALGIIHRDVQPDNVWMYQCGRPLLANFVNAIRSNDCSVAERCGQPGYTAPEVLIGKIPSSLRTKFNWTKIDCFALGVVAHLCLCGEVPVRSSVTTKCKLDTKLLKNLSAPCRAFLEGMLEKNVDNRFSARTGLKCEWLTDGDPESVQTQETVLFVPSRSFRRAATARCVRVDTYLSSDRRDKEATRLKSRYATKKAGSLSRLCSQISTDGGDSPRSPRSTHSTHSPQSLNSKESMRMDSIKSERMDSNESQVSDDDDDENKDHDHDDEGDLCKPESVNEGSSSSQHSEPVCWQTVDSLPEVLHKEPLPGRHLNGQAHTLDCLPTVSFEPVVEKKKRSTCADKERERKPNNSTSAIHKGRKSSKQHVDVVDKADVQRDGDDVLFQDHDHDDEGDLCKPESVNERSSSSQISHALSHLRGQAHTVDCLPIVSFEPVVGKKKRSTSADKERERKPKRSTSAIHTGRNPSKKPSRKDVDIVDTADVHSRRPSTEDVDVLLQDLRSMALGSLKRKARSLGIRSQELDDADDTDDPFKTVINLIMTRALQRPSHKMVGERSESKGRAAGSRRWTKAASSESTQPKEQPSQPAESTLAYSTPTPPMGPPPPQEQRRPVSLSLVAPVPAAFPPPMAAVHQIAVAAANAEPAARWQRSRDGEPAADESALETRLAKLEESIELDNVDIQEDAALATSTMYKPLEHGTDMVIQSLTKYYEDCNKMTGG